jgi:hypothetical protein
MVPPNTTATVWMPAQNSAQIKEGGQLASDSAGVKFVGAESDMTIVELNAGKYCFEMPSRPIK